MKPPAPKTTTVFTRCSSIRILGCAIMPPGARRHNFDLTADLCHTLRWM